MEIVLGKTVDFMNWKSDYNLKEEDIDILDMLDRVNYIVEILHPNLVKKIQKIKDHNHIDTTNMKSDEDIPPKTFVVLLKPQDLIKGKLGRRTTQGIYKVVRKTKLGNYVLETQRGKPLVTPVHPSRIRVIGGPEAVRRLNIRDDAEEVRDDDDPDVFEVEEIVGHKNIKGHLWYHIKWLGYDDNTWEPEAAVHADELIEKYWKTKVNNKRL
jgi:hypothetical protein